MRLPVLEYVICGASNAEREDDVLLCSVVLAVYVSDILGRSCAERA